MHLAKPPHLGGAGIWCRCNVMGCVRRCHVREMSFG